MKKYLIIILSLLFAAFISVGQQVQFNIQSSGSNATIDSAAQYAASLWSPFLLSNIPIKVNFNFISLGAGGTLGITVPNGRKDFQAAPVNNVWYPSCLANAISNSELNIGEVDMDIVINSDVNWYFGMDGNPGFNQFDFVSVFMHEIGHGLGILSLAKVENGLGSFGEITSADFFGIATFPFPELNGRPSIFDIFVVNDSQQQLIDTSQFPNNTAQLAAEMTSNQLFYDGVNGLLANDPDPVPLYAPGGFALGSSVLHLNENSFPPADSNSLMTPFSSMGEVEHHPGSIVLGILQDIGWPESVNPASIATPESSGFKLNFYQNGSGQLTACYALKKRERVELKIYGLDGRFLSTLVSGIQQPGKHQRTWNIESQFKSKFIVYQFTTGNIHRTGKLFLH